MDTTYTFAQHHALARLWAQWNGQRGTEAQGLRIMNQVSADNLARMLTDRGVDVDSSLKPVRVELPKVRVQGFDRLFKRIGEELP